MSVARRSLVVATHGHCFDGMASAALFLALWREVRATSPGETRILSCGYGPQMSQIPAEWLTGEENAILDFRFTRSPRLTWYFDHHATGFGSPEERDEAILAAKAEGKVLVYEPTYGSCAKLIADTASSKFGLDLSRFASLISWADRIDRAAFASAAEATSMEEPVLRLAAVLEHHGDRAFLERIVPRLLSTPLPEVAGESWVGELWGPIGEARALFLDRVAKLGRQEGVTAVIDLSSASLDVTSKFAGYALFPGAIYSVMLLRTKQCFKLSVGYNPWSGAPRRHDIASICKRLGGGGHPVVGAATFRLGEAERARKALAEVVEQLNT